MSENFISPLRNIADAANNVYVTEIGGTPIDEVSPGASASPALLTYSNFGSVDTYGIDISSSAVSIIDFEISGNDGTTAGITISAGSILVVVFW